MNMLKHILLLTALVMVPVMADYLPYKSSLQLDRSLHRTDAQEEVLMQKMARVSLSQAQAIAQRVAPQARLVKAELDCEKGNVVYKVKLRQGDYERKVIVDAGNGKVLSNRTERD